MPLCYAAAEVMPLSYAAAKRFPGSWTKILFFPTCKSNYYRWCRGRI